MIISESLVPLNIAKNLKDDFSLIQMESVVKRIRRLFSNKHFNPYEFYNKIIAYVILNYKLKHNDKRVHIIFDHMFSKDNFTVFMITMRVGKQGIPLWFRCFNSTGIMEHINSLGHTYVLRLKKNLKVLHQGKKSRIISLFNIGLILFHRAFMSLKYVKIDFRFILYDA